MAVYSANLASFEAPATGTTTAFTVPSGYVYVVKEISICMASSPPTQIYGIRAGSSARVFSVYSPTVEEGVVTPRTLTFEAGDSLIVTSVGEVCWVDISGYKLGEGT